MGSTIWSETDISTHTTGGTYHNSYQTTAPTTHVSSSSREMNRFYILLEDGSEKPIKTWNLNFGVRDGHRVTACYSRVGNGPDETVTALYNHTTGTLREVDDNIKSLSRPDRHVVRDIVELLLFVAVWIFISIGMAFLFLCGAVAYRIWRGRICRTIDAEARRQIAGLIEGEVAAVRQQRASGA